MMFRPFYSAVLRQSDRQKSVFVRLKVIQSGSILSPSEKLKLWHKENKDMFGPLLENSREKKQRLRKSHTFPINKPADQNKTRAVQNDDKTKKYLSKKALHSVPRDGSILKSNMWNQLRLCDRLAHVVATPLSVRYITSRAGQDSAVQPGYPNDDTILQIRPHENDYAQQYPSVTLILNKTMTDDSKAALEKWKQERIAEIGSEEFNQFYKNQMAVGTKFHTTLKNYFTQPQTQLRIEKEVEGVWTSVSDLLKDISSPKAIESNVVHPVLKYRGIFDAIADYEDKPTLIEWKKSDKPRKSIAMTYDNPVQLAAYFGAVCNDLNYKGLGVRDALLVIAYTDGARADAFRLGADRLREHWAQWLIRLETYMRTHGHDAEKILRGGKRLFEEDIEHM